MPYKIHVANHKPVGSGLGAHIILESPPYARVNTLEEARAALQALVDQGVTDVYAVGFDDPMRAANLPASAHQP